MTRAVKWGRQGRGVHRGADGPGPDLTPPADGSGSGDGLAGDLAAAAGRRWWNRGTLYLGALVLVTGGFLGGVQVQKSYGESTAGPATAASRGQRGAGGFGFPGGPAAAGMPTGAPGGAAPNTGNSGAGGASTTTGTVKLVDGTTLYVETADGTVVTVRTSGDTAIKLARDGALKDLKAGDAVTVEGANSAGTVAATTVTGPAK
ncbi:hypothetical protein ACFFMM_06830 [Micromonospora chaiyaphumensis]|uniref:DUF5666 domain-containing protein n=1 Tax=Micromonospora chaiyaphumensis TaxID=307119 RepID=A0A1C4VLV4_9ACTN|nr:hypothetical protein [Micromonospora chaiyaphumensis]SCE84920.1 hypothetical protein GA0070214_102517 [Micromonospora chaiyaphumensis]